MGKKIGLLILISIIFSGSVFGNLVSADPFLFELPDILAGTYLEDEIIVKFKNDAKAFRIIKVPSGRVGEKLKEYLNRFDVEYAEPNYIAKAFMVPNDTYYNPYQWNFNNPVSGHVNAESAWDISTGSGVVVAVLDTGIAYEDNGFWYRKAPDLQDTCFVAGYDFVNNDAHANDDNSHGTHVAGTIAQQTNNSEGVAGLAFDSCLMPVKVLNKNGSGTYAQVAEGIYFAVDNGAKVINLSLGGPASSDTLKNAIKYAYDNGVTVIAAVGNDGSNFISYPAGYDDYVIAVGATRFDETLAYYSNYGAGLDVVAPGGDLNVDQNNDGRPDGILQNTFSSGGWNYRSFGYWFFQGTSMAVPHVSAVAALLIANGNAVTPNDIRSAIQDTAKDLGQVGRDNNFGWGLVNAHEALQWNSGSDENPSEPPIEPPTEPENSPPVAIAGLDKSVYVGENTNFDGSGSYDPDGNIIFYEWDFGDGDTSTGAIVNHSYYGFGNYIVTLTVTDDGGLTDTDQVMVTVVEARSEVIEFSDNFEDGTLNKWIQDSQNDWFASSHSSSQGSYAAQVDGRAKDAVLILDQAVDLSMKASAKLTFSWFIERNWDRREYICLDVYSSGIWHNDLNCLSGNTSEENQWIDENINLDSYLTNDFKIRFRAKVSSSVEDGYVDNVTITSFN